MFSKQIPQRTRYQAAAGRRLPPLLASAHSAERRRRRAWKDSRGGARIAEARESRRRENRGGARIAAERELRKEGRGCVWALPESSTEERAANLYCVRTEITWG